MPVFKTGAIGHSATSPMDFGRLAGGGAVGQRREFNESGWQRQRPYTVRRSVDILRGQVHRIFCFFPGFGRGMRGQGMVTGCEQRLSNPPEPIDLKAVCGKAVRTVRREEGLNSIVPCDN